VIELGPPAADVVTMAVELAHVPPRAAASARGVRWAVGSARRPRLGPLRVGHKDPPACPTGSRATGSLRPAKPRYQSSEIEPVFDYSAFGQSGTRPTPASARRPVSKTWFDRGVLGVANNSLPISPKAVRKTFVLDYKATISRILKPTSGSRDLMPRDDYHACPSD
jgi:hypothetical protein